MLGENLYFTKATEPTNIIWENRQVTKAESFKRLIVVFALIVLMILVSFSLIFLCMSYSVKANQRYPAVDCSVVKNSYGNSLEKYAVEEHKDFYVPPGQASKPLTGTLQCFCE